MNGGDLPDVPVPDSIIYDVISFELGSLTVAIDVGYGWWTYRLARE